MRNLRNQCKREDQLGGCDAQQVRWRRKRQRPEPLASSIGWT